MEHKHIKRLKDFAFLKKCLYLSKENYSEHFKFFLLCPKFLFYFIYYRIFPVALKDILFNRKHFLKGKIFILYLVFYEEMLSILKTFNE